MQLNRRGFLESALGGVASGLVLGPSGWAQQASTTTTIAAAAPGRPDTLFLTWQRDPTTTMTIQWIGRADASMAPPISYSRHRQNAWAQVETRTRPFPRTDQTVFRAELTGLTPGTEYEFRIVDVCMTQKRPHQRIR